MDIVKTFRVPIKEETARERILSYFAQAGYRRNSEDGGPLSFQRGSKAGSWIAANPSQLLTLAKINIKPKANEVEVQANFDIKTVIKDDTHFTDEFWAGEIKEFEIAVVKGEYFPLKKKNLTFRTLSATFRSLGGPLAYIFIWAIIAMLLTFLITRLPGFPRTYPEIIALLAMIASGVGVYYFSRYWKKRQ